MGGNPCSKHSCKSKKYVTNVSACTLTWYDQALRWLKTETPDERALKDVVIRMRQAGLKARSVNSYRTAINSYLHWQTGSDQPCGAQCPHPRISRLRDEEKVPPTFTAPDMAKLLAWKPKSTCDRRLPGPDFAGSLTNLGLIDEYRLYLYPIVLGRGKPFFVGPRPRLRLMASDRIGESVIRLTYVPA